MSRSERYDARRDFDVFARDTARVVTGASGRTVLFNSCCPTPVLAFALRRLGADAGVMVTASHNPPGDSGYKVYLGGRAVTEPGRGAQIIPPNNKKTAAAIAAVGPAARVPRPASSWGAVGAGMVEEYLDAVERSARAAAPAPLRIVLTTTAAGGCGVCFSPRLKRADL